MDDVVVFIRVKIPILNESSKLISDIVSKVVKRKKEPTKIINVKKYL